jgi:2-(3-amino-3-carboxypropyl)histidine synthase
MVIEKIAIKEIRKNKDLLKGKKVFVQMPEGLKYSSIKILNELKKINASPFLCAEPCFGACDIRDKDAKLLNCDIILHFGHTKFYKNFETEIPVIYIPLGIEIKIKKEILNSITENKVGIVSNIQHLNSLENVKKSLEEIGKEVVIGGYILGCYFENAKKIEKNVDCILFIGSGSFHVKELKRFIKRPVYHYDPEKNEIIRIEEEKKKEIKKIMKIEKLKDAKKVGILISTKPGQYYKDLEKVEEILKRMKKEVYKIVADRITDEKLIGIDVDIFLNTACPRIEEDYFKKPIININDFLNFFDN